MIQIIGISGVGGSGKTTLVKALADKLNAAAVHWDDFDSISQSPPDYVAWYQSDRDYQAWDYPALADVLKALKSGKRVAHPTLKTMLHPTPYILFDAPLGYLHQQTGQYIDRCFHIFVPLDISLCRRLLRDYKNTKNNNDELLAEIEHYLNEARPLFFDDNLQKRADNILNGTLPLKQLIIETCDLLEKK